MWLHSGPWSVFVATRAPRFGVTPPGSRRQLDVVVDSGGCWPLFGRAVVFEGWFVDH